VLSYLLKSIYAHYDIVSRTPGKVNLYKHASTPGKFTVFEDSEDEILREMKRKNFKIGKSIVILNFVLEI
jgi:hypothetical protein